MTGATAVPLVRSDSHGKRLDLPRWLADLIPNAELVEVPDAYVLSMLEQPEAVAAALSAILLT